MRSHVISAPNKSQWSQSSQPRVLEGPGARKGRHYMLLLFCLLLLLAACGGGRPGARKGCHYMLLLFCGGGRPGARKGRHYMLLLFCLLLLLAGCGGGSGASSRPAQTVTPAVSALTVDAYGKPIVFPSTPPQHIVSMVPTISEILGALHLEGRVAAVDYYTNYPADLTSLPKISDVAGKYNVEQIVSLKPDLVLSYGGETQQYDSQLNNLGLHMVDLPTGNLGELLQVIVTVGRLTFTQNTATQLVSSMQQQINKIKSNVAGTTAPKAMIELDDSTPGKPYVYGGGSYGDELLQDANAMDIFHGDTSNGGYPQVTDEAIIAANPQFIILTEPPTYGGDVNAVYKRPNWGSIAALKMHHVYRVNTDLIGRPGPRLVEGLQCVAQILHPDKFSSPLPDYCSGTI